MIELASFRATPSRAFIVAATLLAASATLAAPAPHGVPAPVPEWRAPLVPYGGPDTFGYTWAASTEVGGPVFSWIDISTTGTLVTGLADDNSAAPIALPFPFRYYWTDISQITIGSNGWIALGSNISNIASCFPSIPAAGGPGDQYVAPFMGDLNFTGPGNPGTVRYFIDVPNQRVVVSYLNVPYWQLAAPTWTGSNTFQVILDAPTRSIKFQYQGLTAFTANASCVDLVGGIESPQGSYGLQLFNDTLPAGNRAVEFTYPNPPLITVIDPAPNALLNPASAGSFVVAGQPKTLTAAVVNDGSGDTTSAVSVRGRLIDSTAATVYDQTVSVPTLPAGTSAPVTFAPDAIPAAGHFSYRVDVSGGGDINAGNNARVTELVAVPASGPVLCDFVGTAAPTTSLDWNNSPNQTDDDGLGVLIVPPGPGYAVTSVGAWIVSNTNATNYKLKLVDNDGPGGLPLTNIAGGDVTVPQAEFTINNWKDSPLPAPVPIDANGTYLVWIDRGTIFLGVTATAPLSRRHVELLGGGYGTWRTNETQDAYLRVTMSLVDLMFRDGFE